MVKTVTFTVMHISVAFTIVYVMTGDFMVGGAVAIVEPLVNSVAYFFHERLWERRRLKRAEPPSAALQPIG